MSKFLSGSGNVTVQDLSDGSLSINAAQLNASNLIPNFPVKADSNQKLYSTILNASDIQGVLVNPYNGIIEATDFETQNYFSVNNQLQYINNFEDSTLNNTNITGSVNITSQVVVPKITDTTQTVRIELDDTDVNVIGQNFTFNGLDVLTGTIPNLQDLEDKTFHIQLPLSGLGTIFSENVYAEKFVTNGGTNQQYVMGDGSTLQYSANSGNSNFYLYNNGTDQDPTPANGFITYNTVEQKQASIIYVSHRTRDNIDIEVFFKNLSTLNDVYIQDQENSDNNITYNITGSPVIVNQAQITIPVTWTSSSGNGATSFGNGHNILLSFFVNSIETDVRLSNLETKTQHVEANASKLTVSRSLELKINDTTDFLAVRSLDGLSNYLIMTDTNTDIYTDVNLNGNDLTDIGSVIISGGSSTEFLKGDGTLDDNDYLLPTDPVITDLQAITQNISGFTEQTQYNKNSTFILRDGVGDVVSIRDDQPSSNLQLVVSQLSAGLFVPLFMQQQRIRDVGAPLSGTDAVTRDYVDTSILPLTTKTQNITATASENVFNKNSSFVLRVADSDSFTVKNDDAPFSTAKFIVSNTSVQVASVPLLMNTQKITLLGDPTISTDATTKSYVDNAINLQGLSPYYRQAKGLTSVTTNGLNETIMNITPTFGSYTWTDTAVGQTRHWKIQGAQTRGNFSATYTIRLKTNGNTNITWVLPATPSAVVNNQLFSIEITQTRQVSNALYYFLKFNSFDATAAGYSFFTSQNAGGNVVGLNVSGTYTITIQSSIASSSLTVHNVDITAILK